MTTPTTAQLITRIPTSTHVQPGKELKFELVLAGNQVDEPTVLATRNQDYVNGTALNEQTEARANSLGLTQTAVTSALREVKASGTVHNLHNLSARPHSDNPVGRALSSGQAYLVISVPEGSRTLLDLDSVNPQRRHLYVATDAPVDVTQQGGWSVVMLRGRSDKRPVTIDIVNFSGAFAGQLANPGPFVDVDHLGGKVEITAGHGLPTLASMPLPKGWGKLTDSTGEPTTVDQLNADFGASTAPVRDSGLKIRFGPTSGLL